MIINIEVLTCQKAHQKNCLEKIKQTRKGEGHNNELVHLCVDCCWDTKEGVHKRRNTLLFFTLKKSLYMQLLNTNLETYCMINSKN